MALSQRDQDEFDELVDARQKRKASAENAEREYQKASLEVRAFLAARGITKARASNGLIAELTEVIDWQHINTELVERDFPKEDYPGIYVPSYKALKALVNEKLGTKDTESTAGVSKYTGFTQQLRVRRPRPVKRRKR